MNNGMDRNALEVERKRLKKERQKSLGSMFRGSDHMTPASVRFYGIHARTCYEARRKR